MEREGVVIMHLPLSVQETNLPQENKSDWHVTLLDPPGMSPSWTLLLHRSWFSGKKGEMVCLESLFQTPTAMPIPA